MGIYGFWQRYCGSCGFDWDEARAWGLIVFPSEWKAVSLSGPVCQGTNCRNNVGKRALAERPVFQGVFSDGVDRVEGEREVLQDKHATGAEIIKTLLSLLACKTLDLSKLFQVWFFFFCCERKHPSWLMVANKDPTPQHLTRHIPGGLCHPSRFDEFSVRQYVSRLWERGAAGILWTNFSFSSHQLVPHKENAISAVNCCTKGWLSSLEFRGWIQLLCNLLWRSPK